MNMKNNLMIRWLNRLFVGQFLLATVLLVSCGDDPEPANEEELITTLIVTLTPEGGGASVVTLKFYDEDGDGPTPPVFTYEPNITAANPAALLQSNTVYSARIELVNETENPVENITEEIEEEADEHLFCFTTDPDKLIITYADTEADYFAGGSSKQVGLATTWTVGSTTGIGTVTVLLRHQPGTKTGDCPGSGETDIEVTFNVNIQ